MRPATVPAGVSPGTRAGGLPARLILGMRVDATSHEDAVTRIAAWAREGEPRYVCVASVHNVMQAHDDPSFLGVMNGADLVTPDGMPLVWGLRLLGVRRATRVAGPDLMPRLLARAASEGLPVAFVGGTPDVLRALEAWAGHSFPGLRVAHASSPPFRPLGRAEETALMEEVAGSGARIVLLGLGCPKQERFMARNVGRAPAVLIGVGAAFDFLVGRKRRAPLVLQKLGLEWAYRLATEPRRLWRRYLRHNPRFLALFAAQVVRARLRGPGDA